MQYREKRGRPPGIESLRRELWVLRAIYSSTCPQNYTRKDISEIMKWFRDFYGNKVPLFSRQDLSYYIEKIQRDPNPFGDRYRVPKLGVKARRVYRKKPLPGAVLKLLTKSGADKLLTKRDVETEKSVRSILRRIRRALKKSDPFSVPNPLATDEPGARHFEAKRYPILKAYVITSQFINPPGRALVVNGVYDEDRVNPLDEVVLDHYLRDVIYCYAADYNVERGTYLIDPKRLLSVNLSPVEIGRIFRSSELNRSNAVAVFTINNKALLGFLQTREGRERLATAVAQGSKAYKHDILHIGGYFQKVKSTRSSPPKAQHESEQ